MNNNLPSINFSKPNTSPTVYSPDAYYELEFYKDAEYFSVPDNFVNFIKGVEKLVRSSNEYKRYISYIKETVGIKTCQIHGNIDDSDGKVTIEMHHGPILTLFDIASIIVDDQLKKGKKINSFVIADIVIDEHFLNNIQIVMLSKTDHELVHTRDIFLHFNQAFGSIEKFLKKYKNGLSVELLYKIKKYLSLCEKYDYFDNEILSLNKSVGKWEEGLDLIYY